MTATRSSAANSSTSATDRIEGKSVLLGEGMRIIRVLPSVKRRMIGAWCFLDHFGPVDVSHGLGMRVGPHPHIGLQTVTWLLQGEILHRDSLGSIQLIRPGQLNLMSAGRGISHSEESPAGRTAQLQGAQLWIAQPESARHGEPAFAHHAQLPVVWHGGLRVTILLGSAFGETSPGEVFTPLVGMELRADEPLASRLPLDPAFEYGALVLEGSCTLEDQAMAPGTLLYLGSGRSELDLRADLPARVLLLGGEPFGEEALMWWNFVGRTRAELIAASREWNAGAAYFGEVRGYDGERLQAPLPLWPER